MSRQAPDDTTAACRSAARRLMPEIRGDARSAENVGPGAVAGMVDRTLGTISREAGEWPTRAGQARFLAEMAGEVSNELRLQRSADGVGAQFYGKLRDRIHGLRDAQR